MPRIVIEVPEELKGLLGVTPDVTCLSFSRLCRQHLSQPRRLGFFQACRVEAQCAGKKKKQTESKSLQHRNSSIQGSDPPSNELAT